MSLIFECQAFESDRTSAQRHCQRRISEVGQKLSDAKWWQYQKAQKKGAKNE
jgi:hypothetical protein